MRTGAFGGSHDRDGSTGRRRAPGDDASVIEVFATGTTASSWQRPVVGDERDDDHELLPAGIVRRLADEVHHEATDDAPNARRYRARPGHRPGGAPSAAGSRSGGDADVVRPLLLAPQLASEIVLFGDMFGEPIPHLRVLPGTADEHELLVWSVEVTAERERPVPATLHLLGSPSMVVTVLELVPARRLRFGRDRFVRYGVEAVDTIARRILSAAA